MASLVQYGSSDESSSENESDAGDNQKGASAPVSNLLKALPTPQGLSSFPSISSLLAKRDKNGKTVISVPVAPDSDSDEESRPSKKKKKMLPLGSAGHSASSPGSGPISSLLKALPAPRNQPRLIPSSAFLKKKDVGEPATPVTSSFAKSTAPKVTGESLASTSDSYTQRQAGPEPVVTAYRSDSGPGVHASEEEAADYSYEASDPDPVYAEYSEPSVQPSDGSVHYAAPASSSASMQDLLGDDRFKRLSRGGKMAKQEMAALAENIVDFDENERALSYNNLPSKYMTEEKASRAPQSHQPSKQQKNKHQITYLAFQAKERELELRNQWSENRLSKQQTQSKYGF